MRPDARITRLLLPLGLHRSGETLKLGRQTTPQIVKLVHRQRLSGQIEQTRTRIADRLAEITPRPGDAEQSALRWMLR